MVVPTSKVPGLSSLIWFSDKSNSIKITKPPRAVGWRSLRLQFFMKTFWTLMRPVRWKAPGGRVFKGLWSITKTWISSGCGNRGKDPSPADPQSAVRFPEAHLHLQPVKWNSPINNRSTVWFTLMNPKYFIWLDWK